MFNSILDTTLSLSNFAICIVTALILGFIISFLHMRTTRSNKNFISTLFILPTLVTMVILLVNGNLGTSVAIVGAFSLVRFRSIPGNSKEIMDVFFAMAVGLAVGTGYIGFAVAFTLAVSLMILILHVTNYGASKIDTKVLKIIIPENLDYEDCFKDEFNKYLNEYELIQAKTTNMGSMFELTYNINVKKGIKEKEFIDKLRVKNGNLKISITHPLVEQEL
ncbi:MAG: DUF4956 domain-containing protein [Bacilli bacterium]|nr:DUF4956 domain-containing protein [Bacilli bacterium]